MSAGEPTWRFKVKFLQHSAADPEGWWTCSGLNVREVEELLDWLEVSGYTRREVRLGEGEQLTVRWQR
jgi:hypothetical protein